MMIHVSQISELREHLHYQEKEGKGDEMLDREEPVEAERDSMTEKVTGKPKSAKVRDEEKEP